MQQPLLSLITNTAVRTALRQAWRDSQPGTDGGHEEGGFIVRDTAGALGIVRWPKGVQDAITLPAYSNGKVGPNDIVATFHTHPNTGEDYLQEPSETDKRAVRDDTELKSMLYQGEFVISEELIYLISPAGQVSEIGSTETLLIL